MSKKRTFSHGFFTDSSEGFRAKDKKKKKKKDVDLAVSNMEILESGKVRVGGTKFNIGQLVESNLEDIVISRLDAIISKEGNTRTKGAKADIITTSLIRELRIADLEYRFQNNNFQHTIVIPVQKKNAIEAFHYLNEGVLGNILRTSTLAYVYKKIKPQWVSLNKDDNSNYTNVMFVPNIMVFLNDDNGHMLKHPYKINVLLVALPSNKKILQIAEDNIDELLDKDQKIAKQVERVIGDMMDAAIRCGCKEIITNPFGYSVLEKDPLTTARIWTKMITTKRFEETVSTINFSIEKESLFVTFGGQLRASDLL